MCTVASLSFSILALIVGLTVAILAPIVMKRASTRPANGEMKSLKQIELHLMRLAQVKESC